MCHVGGAEVLILPSMVSNNCHNSFYSKAKVEGTPEHCFIFNDEVNGVKVPRQLNKQWYINTAYDRLSGFGICEGRR